MKLDIGKFAKLARIQLTKEEENKFSKDLSGILEHFKELQKLDTEGISPVIGGTNLKNVFREDKPRKGSIEKGVDKFPESDDGRLKVPNIFN